MLATYAILTGKLPTTRSAYADSAKVVSLYADDQKRMFTTDASTVGEVLDRTNIKLGPHDTVEPAAGTPIPAGFFNINVYRARPVLVELGTDSKVVETPNDSPRLIAADAGIKTYPEDKYQNEFVTDFVGDGTVGEKVTVIPAKPVTVTVDGGTKVLRTQADTVEQLISDSKIPMGEQDTTSLPLDHPVVAGTELTITRVEEVDTTKHEVVDNATKRIYDSSLYIGDDKVTTAGVPGSRDVTYHIEYHNGQEVSRQVLKIENVVDPVTQVVHVGTKIREDSWYKLRVCESGNNYRRNSGNGYYGAYQFDLGTWQANGGTGLPSDASPATQDTIARRVQARRGWAPWPDCSARLGL